MPEPRFSSSRFSFSRLSGKAASSAPPPTPAESLAAHYGTGAGKVTLHIAPSDPATITLTNGIVTRATNKGGSGASFNLTGVEASGPGVASSAFSFGTAAGKFLTFATQPDAIGGHFLCAIRPGLTTSGSGHDIAGSASASKIYYTERSLALDWRYANGGLLPFSRVQTDLNAWHIAEVRINGGVSTLYWDGIAVVSNFADANATFKLPRFGAVLTGNFCPDMIGDTIMATCGTGTPSDLEPSVLAARAFLAATYGVRLA